MEKVSERKSKLSIKPSRRLYRLFEKQKEPKRNIKSYQEKSHCIMYYDIIDQNALNKNKISKKRDGKMKQKEFIDSMFKIYQIDFDRKKE